MRPRRSLSAAYRVAFTYSGAFAVAVLALGTGAYLAADAEFRDQEDLALSAESSELVRDFDLEGMAELRRDIARREVGRATNVFGYALLDTSGRKVAGALATGALAPGIHDLNIAPTGQRSDIARALATRLSNGETLAVALDSDALEGFERTILWLFAGGFLAVAVIGFAGAILLGHFLRVRLERIGGTAAAIAAGHLDRRVPVGRRLDEFDRLGAAVNAMLDRIAGLMDNLRQVSTDLAHDLRTPLGRLRAGLEAALDRDDDPVRMRGAMQDALRHGDELLALFGAILRIAEVERGDARASFTEVDLAEIAADLADSYLPAVADGGRSLRLQTSPPIRVRADRALLAQAIANLIDNAQLHTPIGTTIVVAVEVQAGISRLVVADTGLGVDAADRERITERFVRLDRSRTTAGHGLGLNMVAAIARAHGGTLEITDNNPGLQVAIVLPDQA